MRLDSLQSFTRHLQGLRIAVIVRFSAQLRLPGQSGGSIFSGHYNFDQLHLLGLAELLVLEKGIQFGLGLDRVRDGGVFVPGKRLQKLGVVPVK